MYDNHHVASVANYRISDYTANYQMNQSGAYPSKHVRDWCISKQTRLFAQNLSQEKHLPLENSYTHHQVS